MGLCVSCGRISYDRFYDSAKSDSSTPLNDAGLSDCVTYSSKIQLAADDGEIYQTTPVPTHAPDGEVKGIMMGCWGNPVLGYFRFQLPVLINNQVRVNNANLEMWGQGISGIWQNDHFLAIRVENASDAAVVTMANDGPLGSSGARSLTPLDVRWPPAGGLAWTVGGYNSSPNVSDLINDLVARHNELAANAYIQFWIWSPDCPVQGGGFSAELGAEDRSLNLGREAKFTFSLCKQAP